MSGLLPALCIATALGVWLADRGLLGTDAALTISSAGLVLGLACARSRALLRATALVAAAAGLGGLSLAARIEAAERQRPQAPFEADIDGVVARVQRGGPRHSSPERPRSASETGGHAPAWATVELREVDAVGDPPAAVPERVRVFAGALDPELAWLGDLRRGERVRMRVRLRAPSVRSNPGARSRAREDARRGVGASAQIVHPARVVKIEPPDAKGLPLLGRVDGVRARLAERLEVEGEGGGLLAALALGERGALDRDTRAAFARMGLGHLLAVSGLHLALAAGLAFWPLARLAGAVTPVARRWDTRGLALGAALGMAGGYALLAGFGVPVRRALCSVAALAAAFSMGRRASPLAVLSAAGLGVLWVDPASLFDMGAQLSFAATAALLLARQTPEEPARGPWEGMQRQAARTVGTSAIALAATAPVVAWHGASIGLPGLLANGVAIPWTAFVLLPAAFAAVLAASVEAWVPAARSMLGLAEMLAEASLAAVSRADALLFEPTTPPRATWGLARPALWAWLVGVCFALGLLRLRGTGSRLLGAALLGIWLVRAPRAGIEPAPIRLVALDVGQGDAVLVQGREAALLVDAGRALPGGFDAGRTTVVPALRALGVERLDVLVASHADLDHRGGLPAVVNALPVGQLWLPFGGLADPDFAPLIAAARERRVPVWERSAGDAPLRVGDLRISPLWPPRAAAQRAPSTRNDRSLVLRVEAGGVRALLTGDLGDAGEAGLLARGTDLRADILKLGHHGSAGASSPEWLAAVGARVGIVSAGCSGRGGLPHPDALARARAAGLRLHWTGRDGAVLVGMSPELRARGWSDTKRCRGASLRE